jgi:hypothetical protein
MASKCQLIPKDAIFAALQHLAAVTELNCSNTWVTDFEFATSID